MRYVLLFAVAVAVVASARPAKTATIYPWCAHYMMGNAPQNCGFSTIEQCRLTVAGIGGTCELNPFYTSSPPAAAPPNSRRLRSRGG